MQPVILAPVFDSYATDENLEPNFVRTRAPNQNLLYINSDQQGDTENPAYVVTKLDLPLNRVSRISLSYLSFRNYTPNVIEGRNDTFIFSVNNNIYTITVPEANYSLLQRWQVAIGRLTIALPTFTYAISLSTQYANTVEISSFGSGNSFRIIGGNAVEKGQYMWGLNDTNSGPGSEGTNYKFTSFTESYTRWVDVCSSELIQYSKIRTGGFRIPNGHILRYFLNTAVFGSYEYAEFDVNSNSWNNFNASRSLQNIDIRIIDEFGELYYVPKQCWGAFNLSLVFICQL